jgi:hypothetical protein
MPSGVSRPAYASARVGGASAGPDPFFDAQTRQPRGQLVDVATRCAAAGTGEQQTQARLGAPPGIAERRADVQGHDALEAESSACQRDVLVDG